MNIYAFLFICIPIAIAVLGPVSVMISYLAQASEHRQKQDNARRVIEIREAEARRRAELHEAKIARENNAVVLQDAKLDLEAAKLEIERLKILVLKKELGLTAPEFTPADYSSSPTPPSQNPG